MWDAGFQGQCVTCGLLKLVTSKVRVTVSVCYSAALRPVENRHRSV